MNLDNNPTLDFSEVRTVNAKIKFSFLGLNEKDEFVLKIGFDCEGGKIFMTPPILGSTTHIVKILEVLELRSWEELPRKYARIKINGNKVVAIGNLIEEKWYEVFFNERI